MRPGYYILWKCETACCPWGWSRRTLAVGVPVSSRAIIIISPVARAGVDGTLTGSRPLFLYCFCHSWAISSIPARLNNLRSTYNILRSVFNLDAWWPSNSPSNFGNCVIESSFSLPFSPFLPLSFCYLCADTSRIRRRLFPPFPPSPHGFKTSPAPHRVVPPSHRVVVPLVHRPHHPIYLPTPYAFPCRQPKILYVTPRITCHTRATFSYFTIREVSLSTYR
jgi:hypothetical protein